MESPDVEQLKRISEQLKQTREQKGIALEEIAAQTFIPLRLLKAMDEGRFERLPEPVFVQGFIRRYGDAIGLDGTVLSREFVIAPPVLKKPAEEFLSQDPEGQSVSPAPRNLRANRVEPPARTPVKVPEPLQPEVKGTETDVPAIVPTAPVSLESSRKAPLEAPLEAESAAEPESSSVPAFSGNQLAEPTFAGPKGMSDGFAGGSVESSAGGSRNRWYWFGGLGAAALLGLGAILILGQPKASPPVSGGSSPTVSPSPQATTQATTQATPQAKPPTTTSGPVSLNIQVTDDSWVEVEADGKVLVSEILVKGTQKSWSAQKELILSTGNAKGVTYSYNQGAAKPMGTAANPETLTFPPKP